MDPIQVDEFLLDCLRAKPDETAEIVRRGAPLSESDWKELIRQAIRHGIAPLFYHRLRTVLPEMTIPPEATGRLRAAYLENAARSIWLFNHLGQVLKLLHRETIPVIALKGAHLAELVYANHALRFMGDLDLLVKEDDLMRVDALLLEMGCTPTVQQRIVAPDNNEFVYIMPKRDVCLEIHWSILSAQFPFAIDTAGLWQRAQPAVIVGVETLVFSPEDLLLHLCLHAGVTHGFEPGLKLFCDIDEILRHDEKGVDWELVQSRAREWGAEKCVYLMLRLSRDLLEVPLPPGLLETLRPADFDERFVALARDQIFSRKDRTGPPLSMWPAVAGFWGAPRLRDKVRLFLKGFFLPREAMARLYPAPVDSVRIYFYYIVRLRDLLRVYGRDVWRWLRGSREMQTLAQEGRDITALKDWLTSR